MYNVYIRFIINMNLNKYPPFNYNNCVIVFAKDTFYLPSSGAKPRNHFLSFREINVRGCPET